MNINKSYIRTAFKSNNVQLSEESLEDIVRHLRVEVSKMAQRCKENKIKRLTSSVFWLALGQYNKFNLKQEERKGK